VPSLPALCSEDLGQMNSLVGRTLANRFRLDALLSRGSKGDVYKAWDRQLSEGVAVKVVHSTRASHARLEDEAQREAVALDRLRHPNIVGFRALERDGDLIFIVMDHVEGRNLRDEITSHGARLGPQWLLDVLRGMCSALQFAHEAGYVHRDLRPANIIITPTGSPVITDFGIAHLAGQRGDEGPRGSVSYMAPEQVEGGEPSPAIDIYALGVILYEVLSGGRRPFSGESPEAVGATRRERIRWEQIHLQPRPLRNWNPGIPTAIESVVMRCLQKDPARRYASADALLGDLERFLPEAGTPPAVPGRRLKSGLRAFFAAGKAALRRAFRS